MRLCSLESGFPIWLRVILESQLQEQQQRCEQWPLDAGLLFGEADRPDSEQVRHGVGETVLVLVLACVR